MNDPGTREPLNKRRIISSYSYPPRYCTVFLVLYFIIPIEVIDLYFQIPPVAKYVRYLHCRVNTVLYHDYNYIRYAI